MSNETKIFLGIIIITIIAIVGGAFLFSQPTKTINPEILSPNTAWATGSATPKSTLVEFSDYECPACKQVKPIVNEIISKYSAKGLRFVYRHFPLPQHKYAIKAAATAEAAGKQGKFWEMGDLLFDRQSELSDDLFPKLATELKLDVDQFSKDQISQETNKRIGDDTAAGNQVGINATPTFFLNGVKVNLKSFGELEVAVADSLK
ncbi:MAG: Protein-disulfide isomerase [Microgenomates group bacterium GW2011_GWA2_44_7]|nr:MAG: Protein-disulfide isomerase [Microgenomates group bacterium GW2011_GWA2_44_7]KKT78217.1 MAG: Protein-disulfide isomerase [Microgenomates group bacterium GW2011_GWB1_44_8]